jgi:hypothetical protein
MTGKKNEAGLLPLTPGNDLQKILVALLDHAQFPEHERESLSRIAL